jgi:isopenicillin-N epimerase
VVGVGWGNAAETSARGARKFETLGQRNDATIVALGAALRFHELIGPSAVEARIFELGSVLKEQLTRLPGARLVTPAAAELSAGVIIVRLEGADHGRVYERLYAEHGIAGAPTGGIRLCPHVYTTLDDVERAAAAVAALAA